MPSEKYVVVTVKGTPEDFVPEKDRKGDQVPLYQRIHSLLNSNVIERVPVFGIFTRTQNETIISNRRATHHLPKDLEKEGYSLRDITEEQYENLEKILNLLSQQD